MIQTIFFDLDGTLFDLDKPMFVQKYYEMVQKAFSRFDDAKKIAKAILQAEFAFQKNDGSLSNEGFFETYVVSATGLPFATVSETMTDMYAQDFPNLHVTAKQYPDMPEIIQILKRKGYQLMVLTNPVFPLSAVHERIRWAGLNPEDFSYITSYETCHYCKPKPEFYLEVLNRFQLHKEEVMMIGNDMQDDIQPAMSIGLKTYYETDSWINATIEPYDGLQGNSQALLRYVQTLPDCNDRRS